MTNTARDCRKSKIKALADLSSGRDQLFGSLRSVSSYANRSKWPLLVFYKGSQYINEGFALIT